MADKKTSDLETDTDPEAEAQKSPEEQETDPTGGPAEEPDLTPDPAMPSGDDADTAEQEATVSEDASAPEVSERAPEPSVQRKSGFGAAVLGGVVAAGLGFLAAKSSVLDQYLPEAFQSGGGAAVAALEETITGQAAAVAELQQQVAGLRIPDIAPIESRVETLGGGLDAVQSRLEELEGRISALGDQVVPLQERLTALEKRPISEGVSETAIAAYERELAALQKAMEAQRTEVEALIETARSVEAEARQIEDNAAAIALMAANRSTVAQIRAKIDAGSGFAGEVADLQAAGIDVPEALSKPSEEGVATLTALAEAFPASARRALAADRSGAADGNGGLGAFLQRQLGARSVKPREGDDADAVLSRAEADVIAGRLSEALGELQSLSDETAAAMAEWADQAQTRLSAVAAADALAQSLNQN